MVGRFGRAVGQEGGGLAADRGATMPPDADALSAALVTTVYTYDSHARLLAVTWLGGAVTSVTYPIG